MSKPTVFVIGSTGSVGSATVRALSASHASKAEIVAGVRHPDKADSLKALPNVRVVQATMGDPKLAETFVDVNTLYIVTPSTEDRARLAVSTAMSAKQAGVQHIVVASMTIAGVADAIIGRQFGDIEDEISKLGVAYTFLRLPMFLENICNFKHTIVSQGVIFTSTDSDKPVMAISVEDIGKASAAILVDSEKHANETISLISCRVTFSDIAKALSKALGKEVKHVQVPCEATKKGMLGAGFEEWRAESMVEMTKLVNSSVPAVSEGDVGVCSRLTGEQALDLRQWITKHIAAFQ